MKIQIMLELTPIERQSLERHLGRAPFDRDLAEEWAAAEVRRRLAALVKDTQSKAGKKQPR